MGTRKGEAARRNRELQALDLAEESPSGISMKKAGAMLFKSGSDSSEPKEIRT